MYGDLTLRLAERIGGRGALDVVDVLSVQLENLKAKLKNKGGVTLYRRDSTALGFSDASYDHTLLFFLLHEQPADVRRATLAEAIRVTRPGGRIVLVDYHRPSMLHPMRPLLRLVLGRLEPYALELWREPLSAYLPHGFVPARLRQQTYCGGLYQKILIER